MGERILALVFTPPKERKQGKRSINPTHPNTGQERLWSSSRKPEKRFRARGGGMEKWGGNSGGQREGSQRSGAGMKTALKTPERQRQSGKPRLMCQKQQMRPDMGQSLPCLYRSDPGHPGNRSDCVSMAAASEPIHTERFQHFY